ncbi:MAG: hypothetical protein ISS19_17790 [Bacteroidales bacterium]|nr:hypothetical protein [Bacteroidales bacterium]
MKDKEIVQLNGKVFLYYSNKGLVFRYPTGISSKDQSIPENQNIINSLVKKLRDKFTPTNGYSELLEE